MVAEELPEELPELDVPAVACGVAAMGLALVPWSACPAVIE
jgi:hypothetical protein